MRSGRHVENRRQEARKPKYRAARDFADAIVERRANDAGRTPLRVKRVNPGFYETSSFGRGTVGSADLRLGKRNGHPETEPLLEEVIAGTATSGIRHRAMISRASAQNHAAQCPADKWDGIKLFCSPSKISRTEFSRRAGAQAFSEQRARRGRTAQRAKTTSCDSVARAAHADALHASSTPRCCAPAN